MSLILININGKDAYYRLPTKTVEAMLEDHNLVNDYFEEVAKKAHFDTANVPSASGGTSATTIQVGKFDMLTEIPSGIDKRNIVRIGCCRNKIIMRRVKIKRSEGSKMDYLPVDIIQRSIGIFGPWHLGVIFMITLCKFPIAFHQFSIIFLAPLQTSRCTDDGIDKCSENCTGHEYDTSIFKTTIISEWDLICEKHIGAAWSQSIVMVGILFGNIFFGFLSDIYGRKKPFILEVVIQTIAGVATAFVPWFWAFLCLRFLTGFATGGTMVTSFVLVMEIVGLKRRTIVSILYQLPNAFGLMLMSLVSYFVREWRIFQIAISAPAIILLSYFCLIPESPRWLLLVGKRDKAVKMLTSAAKRNKMSTDLIAQDVDDYLARQNQRNAKKGNFMDIVRSPIMRNYTMAICYNWMVCGMCYYGMTQFVGRLGGIIFINVGMAGLIQIPGFVFACWSTNAWGRKWTLVSANILTGVSSLVMIFVPPHHHWINTLCSVIAICGVCLAFATVYIYSGELFPTSIRNIGIGISSVSGRIGSMIAPFVTELHQQERWLPPVIFGAAAILGAVLCYILPETVNCELPKSIEEVENFEIKRRRAGRY